MPKIQLFTYNSLSAGSLVIAGGIWVSKLSSNSLQNKEISERYKQDFSILRRKD